MKKIVNVLIICTLLLTLAGCSNKEENSNTNSSENTASVNKVSTTVNTTDTTTSSENTVTNEIKKGIHDTEESAEQELASFTTKLDGTDSPRTRNIKITTTALDGTIIAPGKTFSFCNTIGVCTAEKGYEEADAFDHDGNKFKALGGGNCQVSSTLYNVVLQIPELQVVERHPHSRRVYYVPVDKDAAVAHGSVDFKFKNTFDTNIKIYATSDLSSVSVRLVKVP